MPCRLDARGAVTDPATEIKHVGSIRQAGKEARQHGVASHVTDHVSVFFDVGGICRHCSVICHAWSPICGAYQTDCAGVTRIESVLPNGSSKE